MTYLAKQKVSCEWELIESKSGAEELRKNISLIYRTSLSQETMHPDIMCFHQKTTCPQICICCHSWSYHHDDEEVCAIKTYSLYNNFISLVILLGHKILSVWLEPYTGIHLMDKVGQMWRVNEGVRLKPMKRNFIVDLIILEPHFIVNYLWKATDEAYL